MKKVLFSIAIVAAGLFVASCGNKNATSTANKGRQNKLPKVSQRTPTTSLAILLTCPTG